MATGMDGRAKVCASNNQREDAMGLQDRDYMKDSGPAARRKTQRGLDPKVWGQAQRSSHRGWKPYLIWISVLGLIWYLCSAYLDSHGYTLKRMMKEVSNNGPWIEMPLPLDLFS